MKELAIEQSKKIELEILNFFHKFCEENKLTYYLAYGTLLGAVRHKGFIPWDDDIDVYMPRNDYEQLLKTFNKINNNKDLNLISVYNIQKYYLTFAKLVNTKTFVEQNSIDYKLGLFIDIFPIDNLSDSYQKSYMLYKKVRFIRILKDSKVFKYKLSKNIFKNFIRKIFKTLLCFIPTNYLIIKINEISQKYKDNINSKYIGHLAGGSKNVVVEREWFKEKILLDFEEYKFWCPKEYDKVLKINYGNYMELPPEEKRKIHFVKAYMND